MKNILWIVLAILFLAEGQAFADKIYLKNGQVLEGDIAERGAGYILLMQGRNPTRLYQSQIDRIENTVTDNTTINILTPNVAGVPKNKAELIMTLLKTNGTLEGVQKKFDKIISTVPEERKEEVKRLLDLSEIAAQIMPIYDKYFTEGDLKDMIKFYQSPAGQKAIQVTPALMKEALEATVVYFNSKLKK